MPDRSVAVGQPTREGLQFIATNPGCNPGVAEVVVTAGETVTQNIMIDC